MAARPHKPDYLLMVVVLLLLVFGLVAVTTASSVVSFERYGHNYHFLNHQLLYGVLPGLIIFFAFSRIKYLFWRRMAIPLLIISIVLF